MRAPKLFHAQLKLRGSVVAFFNSLARWAMRHPKQALLTATVVTLAATPGIVRLKLRTDGLALVSPNAPEVLYDKAIRNRFGIEDQLVVVVRSAHPDGIFNPTTLQLVRDLTAGLRQLPGINPSDVMSLATEPGFRVRPGTLDFRHLLDPPLDTQAELDQLREDLRRIELYNGTLVSNDGKSTALLVGVPAGADRQALYQQVLELTSATATASDEIVVTGAPVAESLLGLHILEDLGVPRSLLGLSTRAGSESVGWRVPRSLNELRRLIAQRVGLVPVAALVMVLVFFLTFRNLLAALVPLPGVVATMLFVFGLMGWFRIPVYLTMAVMPVLLTTISVTNDIYLFTRYFGLLRQRPGAKPVELLGETFDALACPVATTSLTAGIGFLSFGFSPLGPVRAFGIVTGIGVLFGLFYSLTVVPAMLTLLNPAWLVSKKLHADTPYRGTLASGFSRLGVGVMRWRWWAVGGALLVTAITPLGLRHLVVQDSWTDAFDPSSDFRRATRMVNEEFYGMHLLFVCVEAPQLIEGQLPASALAPEGIYLPAASLKTPALLAGGTITLSVDPKPTDGAPTRALDPVTWRPKIQMVTRLGDRLLARLDGAAAPTNFWPALRAAGQARFAVPIQNQVRPDLIRTIGKLGDFIRQRRDCAVGGVLSPANLLVTTRFMARPYDPNARRLGDDPTEIKLLWDYYGMARGQEHLRQVVDSNYWDSLTTVFLKDANFVDTARLMAEIRAYEREHLAPQGIKLGFAGDVAVSEALIHGIVTTQFWSLALSVAGIGLVTTLLGGSWRWGVYCVLPSLLAVLLKFAVMGWAGIPLGVATSMFAAMTLGIGVNCAIHLLEAYARARSGAALPAEALRQALSLTGPPALINTLAVSLGFSVLMLSQVPANARLGLLLVLGLVNCFVASFLLLPVLLHWWPPKPRGATSGN